MEYLLWIGIVLIVGSPAMLLIARIMSRRSIQKALDSAWKDPFKFGQDVPKRYGMNEVAKLHYLLDATSSKGKRMASLESWLRVSGVVLLIGGCAVLFLYFYFRGVSR